MTSRFARAGTLGAICLAACGSSKPAAVEPPPTSEAPPTSGPPAPLPPLAPLAPSLVAASSELALALRATGPLRLQRIARARAAVESVVGRRAELVGAGKLGRSICALEPTILGVGGSDRAAVPGGRLVVFEDETFRFDPELHELRQASSDAKVDDPPGVEPARFAWVGDRLVDLETNGIVARGGRGSVLFHSRSGRLRVLCDFEDGAELRSLPSGKLLFEHDHGNGFADDVAGLAGVLDSAFDRGQPFLAVHDVENGRELQRFTPVLVSMFIWNSVTVAADGRTLATNTLGDLTWLERSGRRVVRNLGDGSSFQGRADGPYFTRDSKRACANHLGEPEVLPRPVPPDPCLLCAFAQRTPLHRDAVIVTVKPDPPWRILRGRAAVIGNFARTLGASAATADGQRVAVIETAEPIDGWRGDGRIRLVDAKTGATLRTWPVPERGLYDLQLRFVDGDAALVLEGGEAGPTRYEIDPAVTAGRDAPTPPLEDERDACGATGWDPMHESSCAIGPVVGPAELCEGL